MDNKQDAFVPALFCNILLLVLLLAAFGGFNALGNLIEQFFTGVPNRTLDF